MGVSKAINCKSNLQFKQTRKQTFTWIAKQIESLRKGNI